jgi:opacity protein-like surface antigen
VKKVLMFLVLSFCLVTITQAKENQMAVGGNIILAIPMGAFGDAAGVGFGATGTFMYRVAKQIDLTGTIGFLRFGYSDVDGSFKTIPILFGGRYYFTPGKVQPYGAAEIGFHFSSYSIEVPSQTFFGQTIGGGTQSASSTNFGLGFGGGVLVEVSKKLQFDGGLQYNLITTEGSSSGYISFELGVAFGLN